ncbi:hypothetical protein G8C92_14400 [Paenibacillus donghaensis]|uniref:hypothetical protein n=1 Tax=Paenibacillus donghaensis TaxID=414771 RepID=UPI0018847ED7|nr:hypothetical protein [Paenibacillus donghaensis]MBE9915220.1 hypothetical protein [Paenibacillus donghaensis]
MLKMIALLVSMLSPLSLVAAASPAAGLATSETAAHHAAVAGPAKDQAVKMKPPLQHFDTMNGISLSDTPRDVLVKKGKPLRITHDRWTGCNEYHYKDAVAGICDGMVDYVHIPVSAEKMRINGNWVSLKPSDVENVLGKPQFVSEDGSVFIRGFHAVKLYRDPNTGAVQGADFFDSRTE